MNYTPAPIWKNPPPGLERSLAKCLERHRGHSAKIIFRADDIGVPGRQFFQLTDTFARHRVPLNLAVVPSWLTGRRWRQIHQQAAKTPELWCFHQHGRSHTNHQTHGKKGEFGSCRGREEIERDLTLGRERLARIMGPQFFPAFTPPWNRCSETTLDLLVRHGFYAVSRSSGRQPPLPPGLPDFFVTVDLHTRKEDDPAHGWRNLLDELDRSLTEGWCGIMLHHQRMNDAAFAFVDTLLPMLKKNRAFDLLKFSDMLR